MARHVAVRELLVGVEGLALLRHLYDGSDEEAARRLDEVRAILADGTLATAEATTEADARTGYEAWSETYDEPGNPLVALEEPAVRHLVGGRAAGRALDAACGTGRHARHLVAQGHDVVGVDGSPGMLAVAAGAVPSARFCHGDLRSLPFPDERFDLVVCGLALAHLPTPGLGAAVAELARVLRLGGRLVVSVLHPFQAHLGWHAPFADASGRRGFVREHPHTHADYLAAFAAGGLVVRSCVEPVLGEAEARAKRRAYRNVPEATLAAYVGLPGALVWAVDKP